MPWSETLAPEELLETDRWIGDLSRSLLRGSSDADDVRQETWLAVLKQSSWSAVSKPWLARVVANAVRKRFRETSRRKRREKIVARTEEVCVLPHEAIQRAELRRQLSQIVVELREPYRSTLVLRFFEEMKLKEIAGTHEVSLNTVKTRLVRGLALVRERLDRLYPNRSAWMTVLTPLAAPKAATTSAAGTGSVLFKHAGVLSMSTKNVVGATCLSVAVAVGVGVTIRNNFQRDSNRAPVSETITVTHKTASDSSQGASQSSAASPGLDELSPGEMHLDSASTASTGAAAANAGSNSETSGGSRDADEANTTAGDQALALHPRTAAMRKAYAELRKAFDAGGRKGWTQVGQSMTAIQASLLGSDEGYEAFLALIDAETDGSFLEALMHHLPLAKTESRQTILDDTELHEAIWERYEIEEDPQRRMALLRFFAFNPDLSASRMDGFIDAVRNDPAEIVRELSVDAIASNRRLIEDSWETLAEVVENDVSTQCKRTALRGLALSDDPRAVSLVHAAFSSNDESIRAAALSSKAGESIPEFLTGGDPTGYLVAEFRKATDARYKKTLVDRLLEDSPVTLEAEVRQALPQETDWSVKRAYREALKRAAELRAVEEASQGS